MTVNSWLLAMALIACWYWGYLVGKWWERIKNDPPPADDNEMMW